MRAGASIDELARDAHAVAGFADTAFEQIAHAELASDLFYVHAPTLVSEAGIACDHEQRTHARERSDDLFHHAIGEVLLLNIATHILERQHGDRWPVGKRQRIPGRGPG